MTYESAPATAMVATHCAACRRPLVDAVSVEMGIGPVCRERYGMGDASDEGARFEANALVYKLACGRGDAGAIARLRELGFAKLADKCERAQGLARAPFCGSPRDNWGAADTGPEGEDAPPAAPRPRIFVEEADGVITVRAPYLADAVPAWREVRAGLRFDFERKAHSVPVRNRAALWLLLCRFYAGEHGIGPRGPFTVGPMTIGSA